MCALRLSGISPAREPHGRTAPRAPSIAAAREIMTAQTCCGLITIDPTGRPQVRTMNPFPPDADMFGPASRPE